MLRSPPLTWPRRLARHVPGLRSAWHIYQRWRYPPVERSDLPTPILCQRLRKAKPGWKVNRRHPRVRCCIGSMGPGGAERQLCNLLLGLKRSVWNASLLTRYPAEETDGHFADPLHAAGIRMVQLNALPANAATLRCLASLPPEIQELVQQLHDTFQHWRPDVVHCWMDWMNIFGGLAALLAGVPAVVLSTRSVNPMHFDYLAVPWYRDWYQVLAQQPRVWLLNNSHAGAADYARWLNVAVERFQVIRNGVDFGPEQPNRDQVERFRAEIGIRPGASLIAGIFRLTEEKQPLVFLEAVRPVLLQKPDAQVVIAGMGPLETVVRSWLADAGLGERVHLLGRRQDVPVILSASDVLLLTSRMEGTPNVLLEAQALGCPVVATRAGGAVEAVADGQTGFLAEVGDVAALSAHLLELLTDPALRKRFRQAGPAFIRQRFGLERMVAETEAVYRAALAAVR